MAFNTPFKMWKRYEFNGGTSDPCIISWPAGHRRPSGEIRDQYHHAIDLVPTILDCARRRAAGDDQGPRAEPLRRRQHALQLRRRDAPTTGRPSSTRCSARAASGTTAGRPSPPTRRSAAGATSTTTTWELYHTDVDRSELHDLAAEQPDRLRELINLWYAEAGANGAFPLDDRSALEIILTPRPLLSPPRNRYVYYPGTAEVPESQAVNIRNRSYAIGALVDIPAAGAEGVLFAHGSRFGGHALYIKDNRLHYVYNFVGMRRAEDRRRPRTCRRREPDPVGRRSTRTARTRPASRPASCRSTTATRRSARAGSRPSPASSRSPARACASGATAASRSPTTTRATRPARSPAAPSTGSPSTSAASPTSTWSARPRR